MVYSFAKDLERYMIVATICNHKGGTGKTTSAMHVAAALGLSGRRTLVIDLDPQGFLTRMLGAEASSDAASSLALFSHDHGLDEAPFQKMRGFDLLPASNGLTKTMRRLNKPTDVLWAGEALREVRLPYDVVLFDTAAAVTVYSLNALVASRHVVIPVTPEYQPVLGAEQTFQTARMVKSRLNPDLSAPLFLFTQVDARKRAHFQYRKYMREKYTEQVLESVIRTSASLSTSKRDGTTAFDNHPHARGAHDYANATDELLRRIGAAEAPAAEAAATEAEAAVHSGSPRAENGAPGGDGSVGRSDAALKSAPAPDVTLRNDALQNGAAQNDALQNSTQSAAAGTAPATDSARP